MLAAYTRFLYRHKYILAIFFTALFIFCAWQAKHLKLKSDFKELLPDNFQSVKDLNRTLDRVGGTASLVVAIESDNPKDSIRFAEDLVAQLKLYPPEYIHTIEYNVSPLKKFFEKNKYLYADLKDLEEATNRLDRRIQQEKLKKTGLFFDFDEEASSKKPFSVKDIEEKYTAKLGPYQDYIDGYLFGENGHLMAVVIRPLGTATGVDFSKKLIAKVTDTINTLNPSSYNPGMKVGLTGKFRRVLFEYQTISEDILSTTFLCICLVGLVVLLYYQRFRPVFLMAWTVFNGVAWIFAITQTAIGYLTAQTAFLGSIIIGNGINHGLILMARYLEERKQNHAPLEALQISMPATFNGTFASSLTTSIAFGTLLITHIKGFSHFGFIGGLGMFLCWVATYTVLPVFLAISEDIRPMVQAHRKDWFQFSPMTFFAKHFQGSARALTWLGVAVTLIAIPLMIHFIPDALEYDFTKLQVKTKSYEISADSALSSRINKLFPSTLSPAVLLTERMDQVTALCDEIMRKNELDPPEIQVVESCKSIDYFVPNDQVKKIAELKKIRGLLNDKVVDRLNADEKAEVEKFKNNFPTQPITLEDVPEDIKKNYRELNGTLGTIVYVYSGDNASLWNGKNLIRFANIIRNNTLPTGETITGSGESVLFADLLKAVVTDGPKATIIAFLAVCLIVIFIYRERFGVIFILGTLIIGVLMMAGVIALLDLKINFFNFIAIPTTFGIGVDYGMNIYQRYKLEGRGSFSHVLKTTGGAVALCSITTIIGYFTLIIARNQTLASFGKIAIVGEGTCILAALIFVPALVVYCKK